MIVSKADSDGNTVIVTSINDDEERINKIYAQAFDSYDPANKRYSAYLKDGGFGGNEEITLNDIKELSVFPQNDLNKVLKINNIILPILNRNGIIGKTYEAIKANTNTDVKITYKDFSENRNKNAKLEKTKTVIDDFNEQIRLSKHIRAAVPSVYSTGNRIMYLRGNSKDGWMVDIYPLKVAIITDYTVNGDPVILIDMKELENGLKKNMIVDRKRKPLFFKDIEDEIKNNYPPEVLKAYKDKEKFAKLDPERTGVIRINDMDRKYGVSAVFKALEDYLMLETFKNSDRSNSKATAKKIIHQVLRKELLENGVKQHFNEMAYAHNNLLAAWQQPTVITTSPPYVEKIVYVEPNIALTDKDVIAQYKANLTNALGINFLSIENGSTVTTAQVSITQLMLVINTITQGLEDVINKFYRYVLKDNNISLEYLPKISIIDSELLEIKLKKELAEFMINRLNASLTTAFEMVGLDIEDEKQKRLYENDNGYDEIFYPRKTAATMSKYDMNETDFGRPLDENPVDPEKQDYDQIRQDNKDG